MDRAPPSLTPAIELLRTSPAPSLTPKNQALPPSSTLVSKVSKSSSSVSVDLPVVDVDPVVSSSSFSSGVPRLPSRGLAPPRRGLHHRTLPELHPAMASVELHLAPTCHGHHRGAQLLPAMASITLCPSSAQLWLAMATVEGTPPRDGRRQASPYHSRRWPPPELRPNSTRHIDPRAWERGADFQVHAFASKQEMDLSYFIEFQKLIQWPSKQQYLNWGYSNTMDDLVLNPVQFYGLQCLHPNEP
jgi:hypothetical protein